MHTFLKRLILSILAILAVTAGVLCAMKYYEQHKDIKSKKSKDVPKNEVKRHYTKLNRTTS